MTDPARPDRVHGLHGYCVLGTALEPVNRVREPVRIHVHSAWGFVPGPINQHVACGHRVRLFDRFPLDQYRAGRDGIYVEFRWRRRVQDIERVTYLIPAEYVLYVARIVARVHFVIHGADGQAAVREDARMVIYEV